MAKPNITRRAATAATPVPPAEARGSGCPPEKVLAYGVLTLTTATLVATVCFYRFTGGNGLGGPSRAEGHSHPQAVPQDLRGIPLGAPLEDVRARFGPLIELALPQRYPAGFSACTSKSLPSYGERPVSRTEFYFKDSTLYQIRVVFEDQQAKVRAALEDTYGRGESYPDGSMVWENAQFRGVVEAGLFCMVDRRVADEIATWRTATARGREPGQSSRLHRLKSAGGPQGR